MDEVIRGDFEVRAAAAQKLVTTGVMKPSEARPMFGLPDAGPKADKLYANAALQELGTPAERISITAAADASQADDQVVADAEEAMGDKPAEPPAPAPKATPPTRRGGRPPKRR
jgi:hypothetical protein